MEDMNINAVIANLGNGNVTTGNISTGNIHQEYFANPTIEALYSNYNVKVYSAYYCFPKESLLSIVETFKAQLLDLLLQFDKELNWNIDLTDKKIKKWCNPLLIMCTTFTLL